MPLPIGRAAKQTWVGAPRILPRPPSPAWAVYAQFHAQTIADRYDVCAEPAPALTRASSTPTPPERQPANTRRPLAMKARDAAALASLEHDHRLLWDLTDALHAYVTALDAGRPLRRGDLPAIASGLRV